jgi:hypothetical protein
MKEYTFDIEKSYLDRFFSPIRTRVQLIEVMMNAIKYMLLNPVISEEQSKGKLVLRIDKMSRLFFFKEDKYFSIVFPFYAKKKEHKYVFSFHNLPEIDSKLTTDVISIIKSSEFMANCSVDFASPISDYQEETNDGFWCFLRELLFMEDGYVRYDYDDNEDRMNEYTHPLNHYDLFRSSSATFKLGIKNRLTQSDFIDLFDINTNCNYLSGN